MGRFFKALEERAKSIDSLLCVGLDPHPDDVSSLMKSNSGFLNESEATIGFCKRLIDETKDVAAAFKPNSAFFEALGESGHLTLKKVLELIPSHIPVVLDAKRGDISSTAAAYAKAAFKELDADCITLHPYMGWDSIEPFLNFDDGETSRDCFILCKTSNPSSENFQTLRLQSGNLLYEDIAKKCHEWNEKSRGSVGMVIGATDTLALKNSRLQAPQAWILAPGVGFQGGNLIETVKAGLRNSDGLGLLIPVSRGISRAENPREAAESFRDQINAARKQYLNSKTENAPMSSCLEPYKSEFFELALDCGVLKFGEFTLKSGRKSPYFFNAGLFRSGLALDKLANFYAQCIVNSGLEFDVLFGPAYKGIPLAAIVAASLSRNFGRDVLFAYNRKEAKDHGEGGCLVGASMQDKRVLIIDDVITGGTAIRESYNILRPVNARVVGVVIALDRQEKVKEGVNQSALQSVKQEFGVEVLAIASLSDLLLFTSQTSGRELGESALKSIQKYRETYGIN